jgi:predicted membrane protein
MRETAISILTAFIFKSTNFWDITHLLGRIKPNKIPVTLLAACWRRATGYTAGVRLPVGARYLLYSTSFTPALGHTQPPIQWVTGALSPEVKRPRREADHSLPPVSRHHDVVLNELSTGPTLPCVPVFIRR